MAGITEMVRVEANRGGMTIKKDLQKICKILSISNSTVTSYLTDIDKQLREERKAKIFSMYLAGYTMQEIADAVGVHKDSVSETCRKFAELEKSDKNLANFQDMD